MPDMVEVDVCAIGAGSGGLAASRTAAMHGFSAVLIERDRMGGDCLNWGCVPSKALLASAHAAQAVRKARRFGIDAELRRVVDADVYAHVRRSIAAIEPQDSAERFESFGVKVIKGEACFVSPEEVAVGQIRIRARTFVIATGARAIVPAIPGLADGPYLTNESIFALNALPRHLIVIGGGPLGVEMAQAHRRLGSQVTLIERFGIMTNEDAELTAVLAAQLRAEGMQLLEHSEIMAVGWDQQNGRVEVRLVQQGLPLTVEGTHVLVAVGRRTEVSALGLERAGVLHNSTGVVVDAELRTTNPRVFAVGDAIANSRYSHLAAYHGQLVVAIAMLGTHVEAERRVVPRVTFTDPEIAYVGLTEVEARRTHDGVRVLRWSLANNDRAVTDLTADGLLKAVVAESGTLLGVGVAAPNAGEVIQPWVLAMSCGLPLEAIARTIMPYPTIGYSSRKLAELALDPPLAWAPRKQTGQWP